MAATASTEHQLDVVVAAAEPSDHQAAERTVLAIGETKADETVGTGRLAQLERARARLEPRAARATPLLSPQGAHRS